MMPNQITHYRIVAKIGEGGMGVVYRAEDEQLHRPVAIKLISGAYVKDPKAVMRFQREVQIASSLNHPHICTVYECGELNGSPYMVLELLEGQTLRDTLGGRPLSFDRVLEFAIQVADAIDDAHEHGIVHRDINSNNIFITNHGVAKVLDFGLAKISGKELLAPMPLRTLNSTVSTPGLAIGTATNMSPEQVKGQEVDRRSDIFSLGIVLYEMATGILPFQGPNGLMVMRAILNKPPPPVSELNPAIPPGFDRIIDKALEKDRALRYQTASDLKTALVHLRLDEGLGRTNGQGDSFPSHAPLAHAVQASPTPITAVDPWDAVAREGRDFAERGSGMMYWIRAPLGGICYPSGFRSTLRPALENPRITKIRFVLDSGDAAVAQAWRKLVLPLISRWAKRKNLSLELQAEDNRGHFYDAKSGHILVSWVFADLSTESCPCFKIFIDDSPSATTKFGAAELHIATTTRSVRMLDESQQSIRIPDTILRARASADPTLLEALRRVVSRWEFLFA